YLEQYPHGKFAALAALRAQPAAIETPGTPPSSVQTAALTEPPKPASGERADERAALAAPADQARQAEAALALPPERRQAIQRWWTALGHDTGGADGQFGPQPRKAITAYQPGKAMRATGYVTADLVQRLSEDAKAPLANRVAVHPPAP